MTSVADNQQAIEALARRLQALPANIRWAYSQQDVILAAAMGVAVAPGRRTAQISTGLKLAARFGLEIVAAKVASIMLLAVIWWRQLRIPPTDGCRRFFVGIGAVRETELIAEFEAMCGGVATVVDQRFPAALAAIYRPKAAELVQAWRDAGRPVFAHLTNARSDAGFAREHVLTYIVRRLHHYAHDLAVFRGLKAADPGVGVAFSSADLPAFAAARAEVETIYFQHGFLRRSLVFPDFQRVVSLDAPEAEHIKSRLPAASVSMSVPAIRPLQVVRRLGVVGDYGDKLARSRGLIAFCRTIGIDVVVRPHPADRSGYWSEWEGVSGVRVDCAGTFGEFLERHRPCVMATWYSTTIYDALLRGVLPVSLEVDEPDVVFPVSEVALAWPEQKEAIRTAVVNSDARHEALVRSLALAVGPLYLRAAMEGLKPCGRVLAGSTHEVG